MTDKEEDRGKIIESLVTRLEDRLAEVERLRALTNWQSIETAPRDGTVILGYDPTLYDIATLMDFDSREGKWMLFHIAEVVRPTHWMPLPEPPGEGG